MTEILAKALTKHFYRSKDNPGRHKEIKGLENKPANLLPIVMEAIVGQRDQVEVFGDDYETEDGTCIRDYIHVLDLVEAHLLAFEKISKERDGFYYNVGTGKGHSNREIVQTIEKIAGKKIKVVEKERRAGDVPILIADSSKIKKELGFAPKYSDIDTIIKSALSWHKKQFKI